MEELIRIIEERKIEAAKMDADTQCINIYILALNFCLTSAKNIYENSIPRN